jgi:DNA (cytosine-5)-methyltransferase 1
VQKGCGEDGTGKGVPVVAVTQDHATARSVALRGRAGGMMTELGGELAGTLRARSGNGDKNYVVESTSSAPCPANQAHFDPVWRVRHLMPVECERLQGFPDHYTLVPYRGKPAADSPRYRVIGNAMAVPCIAWIGRRLRYALEHMKEEA